MTGLRTPHSAVKNCLHAWARDLAASRRLPDVAPARRSPTLPLGHAAAES